MQPSSLAEALNLGPAAELAYPRFCGAAGALPEGFGLRMDPKTAQVVWFRPKEGDESRPFNHAGEAVKNAWRFTQVAERKTGPNARALQQRNEALALLGWDGYTEPLVWAQTRLTSLGIVSTTA